MKTAQIGCTLSTSRHWSVHLECAIRWVPKLWAWKCMLSTTVEERYDARRTNLRTEIKIKWKICASLWHPCILVVRQKNFIYSMKEGKNSVPCELWQRWNSSLASRHVGNMVADGLFPCTFSWCILLFWIALPRGTPWRGSSGCDLYLNVSGDKTLGTWGMAFTLSSSNLPRCGRAVSEYNRKKTKNSAQHYVKKWHLGLTAGTWRDT